ncbi:MAG: TadE/TadG family type IV pilus assembly protein [Sneathiella sp.]
MIEVAVALPVLVLLLFGSFDLVRYVQAVGKVDMAVSSIAAELRDIDEIADTNIPEIIAAAESTLSFGGLAPTVSIVIEEITLGSDGNSITSTLISDPSTSGTCADPSGLAALPAATEQEFAPNQHLIAVKLCAEYGTNFFLSSLIPTSARQMSASAIGHANSIFQGMTE